MDNVVVAVGVHANSPRVHTSQGDIVGSYYQGVERFAGIPYALPPKWKSLYLAVELDFERVRNLKTEFDATKLGAPCIQNPIGDPRPPTLHDAPPPSEDCLTLNIFKPNATLDLPLWSGCSADSARVRRAIIFDGTQYAKEHGIIVVVVSYRLGALGFLPLKDEKGN